MSRPQPRSNRFRQLPTASPEVHLGALGERLAALREARGLSRSQLAALAGIGPVRLKKIEEGRGRLEASLLYLLATRLNVKVAEVVGEDCESEALPLDPEARQLMRFFAAIPAAGIRKSILKLAKALSEKP